MLAVDVDGTLIINGIGNAALIDYLREKKASGTKWIKYTEIVSPLPERPKLVYRRI